MKPNFPYPLDDRESVALTVATADTRMTQHVQAMDPNVRFSTASSVQTSGTAKYDQMDRHNARFEQLHGSNIVGAKPMGAREADKNNLQTAEAQKRFHDDKVKKENIEGEIAAARKKIFKLKVGMISVGSLALILIVLAFVVEG